MLSRSPVMATLPVRDLRTAKQFYSKLGLRLAAGSVREGFLQFRAGGGTGLLCFRSGSKKRTDNTAATFEVKDLAAVMRGLRKKGIEFAEYDLPGVKTVDGVATMDGHVMAWIVDPDGYVLALHQRA